MVAAGIQLVSVFLLLGVDGFLSGGGFYPSPPPHTHTHTYIHLHTHTLTQNKLCALSRPRPLATLISLGPLRLRPPQEKRERGEFPFKKESLKLLLVAESRVRRYETLVTTTSVFFLSLCLVCVCLQNSRISGFLSGQNKQKNHLIKSVFHSLNESVISSFCSGPNNWITFFFASKF